MEIVLLVIRLLLAAVFLVAGFAKLADLAGSRQALRDFGVPAALARPFGVLLSLTELAVAVALLPAASAWWGAIGALVLLLLFVAGISSNLARGRTPDCHCFGQWHSAPAGWSTLARTLGLSALAGFVVGFRPSSAELSAVAWFGQLCFRAGRGAGTRGASTEAEGVRSRTQQNGNDQSHGGLAGVRIPSRPLSYG